MWQFHLAVYKNWYSLLANEVSHIFSLPEVKYRIPGHRIAMKRASTAVTMMIIVSVHPQSTETIVMSQCHILVQKQKLPIWLCVHASVKDRRTLYIYGNPDEPLNIHVYWRHTRHCQNTKVKGCGLLYHFILEHNYRPTILTQVLQLLL